MTRYDRRDHIQTLNPKTDHQQICYLLAGYEFPWDITRALEVALLRTFCVPSISKLLDQTGEFRHHAQKRYDDTGIVVSALLKWGYDSEQGRRFLERMNGIHAHFPITNADYLYVLSTFIYEPVRWCDRTSWRPLTATERLALFYFWQAVGERMGIEGIPDSYEALEQYNQRYEAENFHFAPSNQQVAAATRRMLVGWFPRPLQPLVNLGVPSLLDPALLKALGWQPAPPVLRHAAAQALRLRSRVLRWWPPRHQADFFVDQSIRSYPDGYDVTDIGPDHLRSNLSGS